jgi:hypothetical protein
MLARPCRRCGCGIAVNSVQLKIDKDVAGVDQHKYSTVCERALESLHTPAQAPAAPGTTFRQRQVVGDGRQAPGDGQRGDG